MPVKENGVLIRVLRGLPACVLFFCRVLPCLPKAVGSDKVVGTGLLLASVTIFVYYTLWVIVLVSDHFLAFTVAVTGCSRRCWPRPCLALAPQPRELPPAVIAGYQAVQCNRVTIVQDVALAKSIRVKDASSTARGTFL